jgi:hypothetical protein
VSYTLSRTTRSVENERFPGAFDRAHVVNAAVGYDLGRRWRAGNARHRLHRRSFAALDQGPDPAAALRAPAPRSHVLTASTSARKTLGAIEKAWIAFVAELMNATLTKETLLNEEIVRSPSRASESREDLSDVEPGIFSRRSAVERRAELPSGGHSPGTGQHLTTASGSEATRDGVVTADGWSLSFQKVLLGIGPMQLGDDCIKYAEYSEPGYERIVEVTAAGPQKVSIMYGLGRVTSIFR